MPADPRGGNAGAGPEDCRDHDHSTEDAVIIALENPTPANREAAELAVALLQRRYDHLLRRLDGGDGTPPAHSSHRHRPSESPVGCLGAVLRVLAGSRLPDRAETLVHGVEALHHLVRERDDARGLGPRIRAQDVRRRHRHPTCLAHGGSGR